MQWLDVQTSGVTELHNDVTRAEAERNEQWRRRSVAWQSKRKKAASAAARSGAGDRKRVELQCRAGRRSGAEYSRGSE
ncbi:hypothetical protein Scep_027543 [Stephania cephalantha]|uniref:Uncharacterized protein n=1 Tax=Stephania cephalantha TaxID=152367 RepID=A0AAP0E881_9MAGN